MKAAVYSPYWDTLGGGERYVASFVRLLLDHHWQVDVWWPRDISSSLRSRFSLDISGADFTSPQPSSRYDLLFWVSDGSLPLSFAKKTFVHLQFPFQHISGRSLPNLLKSRFYKFIVNSQFTKKFIDSEYSVTSTVVYPPVDIEQFTAGPKTRTILYVGRFSNLTQSKGQEVLITAFKHLYRRIPGWKLILAGGTSVGTTTEALFALKKSVRGFPIQIVTDPDFNEIKSLYSRASLFWSASGYGETSPLKMEHFGISLVEAMAAGCVPLVTHKGGHPEIVDSGQNGYLWDRPEELERLTAALISDPGKLADFSRSAVTKSKIFSIANFNQAFTALLHV